jgi:hypothetical protein
MQSTSTSTIFYLMEHDKKLNTDTIIYSTEDHEQLLFMLDLLLRYADETRYTFETDEHSHTVSTGN